MHESLCSDAQGARFDDLPHGRARTSTRIRWRESSLVTLWAEFFQLTSLLDGLDPRARRRMDVARPIPSLSHAKRVSSVKAFRPAALPANSAS